MGCKNLGAINNQLRTENLQLKEKVQSLDKKVKGLELLLETSPHEAKLVKEKLPAGSYRSICTTIEIGQYSGGYDQDRNKKDDSVRVYLYTLDMKERFVQVVGRAEVEIFEMAKESDGQAKAEAGQLLKTQIFEAGEIDATYRAGVTGTYYTLVVPMAGINVENAKRLIARVKFHDFMTGKDHVAERELPYNKIYRDDKN